MTIEYATVATPALVRSLSGLHALSRLLGALGDDGGARLRGETLAGVGAIVASLTTDVECAVAEIADFPVGHPLG